MRKGAFTSFVQKPRSAVFAIVFCASVLASLTAFATNIDEPEHPSKLPSEQLMDDVQFAIPGDFLAPFDNLNTIPAIGLDVDDDGTIDIKRPCSCRTTFPIPNGSNPNNGLFDDQIVIATGISGQNWVLGNAYGALSSNGLTPLFPGQSIPEVGNTGVYVLPFIHRDAEGYSIEVQAPQDYPNEVFGPVVNTCFYPDPLIENIDNFYCDSEPDVVMIGSATSDFDGNLFPLTPTSELWITSRDEDGQTFFGQTFSPSSYGAGHYTVRYTFDAGNDAHNAANKTGCSMTVEQEVEVRGSATLACNAGISVVLSDNNCEITITPEMLLASNFDNYEFFEVEVVDPVGNSLGNVVPAEFANQTLPASVTDQCSGARCFSSVTIQDINPPVITLPADTTLACTVEPETAITGTATATDCVNFTMEYTDDVDESTCGNPKVVITRTWVATDDFGNSSSAIQTININRADPADLIFPDDIDISCVDYNADPSVIDATTSGAGQPNLLDEPICGLAYTFTDESLIICGGPNSSQLIIRTWYVLDICGSDYIEVDGNGNDNVQIIRIMDNTAPTITANAVEIVANIPPQSNGLDACSSMGFIPAPDVFDVCSDELTIRIFTPLGEADYLNGIDGTAGGFVPDPGLLLGEHTITYEAEDACGNTGTLEVQVNVIDNLPPVMICDNSLSLSLESSGFGRIYPDDIDEGSFDDCCEDVMLVKLEEEPDSLFREYLEFYCTNDTLEVVLRVYDCFGNFNDCVSSLVVEDRVPPVLVSNNQDVTVTCLDDYSNYLDPDFQAPTFDDNCNYEVTFSYEETIDECGLGTLTRTWTASDNPTNTPAIATQIINIEPSFEFRIQVPDDVSVSCALMDYNDMVINSSSGCEQIEISVTEEPYVLVGDTVNCYRILRTHQIINHCLYDGVSPPMELPRIDWLDDFDTEVGDTYEFHANGDTVFRVASIELPLGDDVGFYQYQQIIEVYDETPPELAYTAPDAFCSLPFPSADNDPCSGEVSFPFNISDDCSGDLTIFYSLNAFNENIVSDVYGELDTLENGNFKIEGTYPVGAHSFFISVFDACGNLEQFTLPFEVVDCTTPTLTCVDVPAFNLQFDGTLSFAPDDFVEFVGDNCSATSLSFSSDTTDMSRLYNCDQVGVQELTVYATDESGNQSSCFVSFDLEDNLNACVDFYVVNGNLKTETEVNLVEAEVHLTGPMQMDYTTDQMGDYAFMDVMEGPGYEIRPEKNSNASNGISTLDLIFISQHIIGVKKLNSPYKMIAADANRSGSISTLDQIQFRKLILGIDSVFSNNTSWRFIPSDFEFTDVENPFLDAFPESYIIDDLVSDTIVDFVAIKVGDVNGSASGDLFQQVDERNSADLYPVSVSSQQLKAGEQAAVKFEFDATRIEGMQFTIDFDPSLLVFNGIAEESAIGATHFGLQHLEQGLISFSWETGTELDANQFMLEFSASGEVNLSEVISLNSFLTKAEAYRQDAYGWEIMQPVLTFEEVLHSKEELSILQNQPNPFSNYTEISFYVPKDTEVTLSIFNVDNKQVYSSQISYEKGKHTARLDKTIFPVSGIYYYRIEAEGASKVKKMIFIKE